MVYYHISSRLVSSVASGVCGQDTGAIPSGPLHSHSRSTATCSDVNIVRAQLAAGEPAGIKY